MPAARRLRLAPLASLAALALAVSACASSGSPGWTYAPQPSITPAPSPTAAASGAASAVPSAGASGAASAAPSAGASGAAPSAGASGAATTLNVVALNIAFDQTALTAPAGAAFTIDFDNQDASVPHNIEIKDASGASKFKGDIVTGPAKATYNVPALTAGAYTFVCDVHPNMTGTLTVQ